MVVHAQLELGRLAAAATPAPDRARDMLQLLRRFVPFDAAWIARADRKGYVSLASADLDPPVVQYLSGPKMAHDIEETGTDRLQPPLSPSDLPYPAVELSTWAECLIPAGIHEALAVGLFEPSGRHVGFLALLSGDRQPPTPSMRERLGAASRLLAQGIDPMRSLGEVSRLVSDAFAGVLLFDDGWTDVLPGLPRDRLLASGSALLAAVEHQMTAGEAYRSFLWPRDASTPARRFVRVTCLTGNNSLLPDLHGIVLLSPVQSMHGLTSRELEVLGMVVDGDSNSQIARLLSVTTRTVAAHVEHILTKLAVPTRTHAAVLAQREGIFMPVRRDPRAARSGGDPA